MKKLTNLAWCACLILMVSCQKEVNLSTSASPVNIILNKTQTSALIVNGINPLVNNVEKVSVNVFGETIEGIRVSDYFVSFDQLDDMIAKNDSPLKLFASTNRISLPNYGQRVIRVGLVKNSVDNLNPLQIAAAHLAGARYNQLRMNKVSLETIEVTVAEANAGSDENGPIDIVVFTNSNRSIVGNNFDGIARFPNNGNPGTFVALSPDTRNYAFKNVAILMMHELGHTLGMAHADFRTRNSCSNPPTNLDPVLGDLLGVPNVNNVCNVAGTDDSGNFTNSVMRACGFFAFNSARFTNEDKTAFKTLYSQQAMPCEGSSVVNINSGCTPITEAMANSIIDTYGINTLNYLIACGIICQ